MKGTGYAYRPTYKDAKTGKRRTVHTWSISYSVGGKRYRESTGSPDREVAKKMLADRTAGRLVGKIIGRPDRVLLRHLRTGLEAHYRRQGNKSLKRMLQAFNNLETFWPEGTRALAVTRARVAEYIDSRLAKDAAPATIAYEVACLNTSFSVAVEQEVLAVAPKFRGPAVANTRTGFVTPEQFSILLLELSESLRPLIQWAYWTGWRINSCRLLMWSGVAWQAREVRLTAGETKSGKPVVMPWGGVKELEQLLNARWTARTGDDGYVFHDGTGQPHGIGALRYGWAKATRRAGLEGTLVHDLRRSAIRNWRLANVSQDVIKKLAGISTDAIFTRYNIVSPTDGADAVAKRFGIKPPQPEGVQNGPEKH